MKIRDSLVGKHPNSSSYVEFGTKSLRAINQQSEEWLKKQSFNKKVPSPRYNTIEIKGNSEKIEWDLRFECQIEGQNILPTLSTQRSLCDGLLHIKRISNLEEYNSEPRCFKTADYVNIGISLKEKGWIGEGLFPKGVFMTSTTVEDENPLIGERIIDIPAFKDTKKQAEAAFRAAREWAKFRTMAVACSGYIIEKLEKEKEALSEEHKKNPFTNSQLYDLKQVMRSRIERTIPFMLELFPDTRIKDGGTSLKLYYEPGILEATIALEMEKAIASQYGHKSYYTPIVLAQGFPIEIISNPKIKGGYDAFISFIVNSNSDFKDKTIKEMVEKELQKYFDIKIQDDWYNLKTKLYLPDAHKVRAEIVEGSNETELHKQITSLAEILTETCIISNSWENEQMPVLKAGYEGMIEAGKKAHFGKLEQTLKYGTKTAKPGEYLEPN